MIIGGQKTRKEKFFKNLYNNSKLHGVMHGKYDTFYDNGKLVLRKIPVLRLYHELCG
jgi:uncharacterized protein affecting Mg2+/Co2+ transport